jgi:hypothetical protein
VFSNILETEMKPNEVRSRRMVERILQLVLRFTFFIFSVWTVEDGFGGGDGFYSYSCVFCSYSNERKKKVGVFGFR